VEVEVDSTTIDAEHARLSNEGFVRLTNESPFDIRVKKVSSFRKYRQEGYEVLVCKTAYTRDGQLLKDWFSLWGVPPLKVKIPGRLHRLLAQQEKDKNRKPEEFALELLESALRT